MATLAQATLSGDERALLERFAAELRRAPENRPHAIWLFGSRARSNELMEAARRRLAAASAIEVATRFLDAIEKLGKQ